MIKCIIVEDESLAQDVLTTNIQRAGKFELVAVCSNAIDANGALNQYAVDLIFLDIQLPGMNGLNFLRSLNNPPLVILTTAYAEYALESYELNVIDYLLKPISFERFNKAVNKINDERLTERNKDKDHVAGDFVFIKSSNKFFRINFSEIVFVEGMKDYLKIHAADFTLVTHQTMNDMEAMLPSRRFMRIHRSYIVANSCIKSVSSNTIETQKARLPVGINYKEKVMQFVNGSKY